MHKIHYMPTQNLNALRTKLRQIGHMEDGFKLWQPGFLHIGIYFCSHKCDGNIKAILLHVGPMLIYGPCIEKGNGLMRIDPILIGETHTTNHKCDRNFTEQLCLAFWQELNILTLGFSSASSLLLWMEKCTKNGKMYQKLKRQHMSCVGAIIEKEMTEWQVCDCCCIMHMHSTFISP